MKTGPMVRRLLLSATLVVAGLAAGLVLTARMPPMAESVASQAPPPASAPAAAQTPAVAAPPGGYPDFTTIAAAAVKGVANISSLQVVRQTNSPFASGGMHHRRVSQGLSLFFLSAWRTVS